MCIARSGLCAYIIKNSHDLKSERHSNVIITLSEWRLNFIRHKKTVSSGLDDTVSLYKSVCFISNSARKNRMG
jgi:hypothetical protein